MVLRVEPTLTRFPTNSLYTPMDNIPLHSISSMCHPWGEGWRWRIMFNVIQKSRSSTKYGERSASDACSSQLGCQWEGHSRLVMRDMYEQP